MNKLRVVLNDQKLELASPLSLYDFVQQHGFLSSTKKIDLQVENSGMQLGFAIALNQQIIPHQQWPSTMLSDGDVIALFQAIAGG